MPEDRSIRIEVLHKLGRLCAPLGSRTRLPFAIKAVHLVQEGHGVSVPGAEVDRVVAVLVGLVGDLGGLGLRDDAALIAGRGNLLALIVVSKALSVGCARHMIGLIDLAAEIWTRSRNA